MNLLARLKQRLAGGAAGSIRVHVILKGRSGAAWYDTDQIVRLPSGATLSTLLDESDRRNLGLRTAIADSPHLRHTLMLNGQRCAVDDNLDRRLNDGDDIYLLAPLAGG